MAFTGTDVSNEALALLQDKTNVHVDPADMLEWIRAGVREVVALKPKAGTVTQLIDIVANAVTQAVPAGTIEILDVLANMGADGVTPGRGITVVTLDRMQAAKANWRRDTGAQVKHVIFDDRDNTVYYVWPAVTTAIKAEARLMKFPTPISALTTTVPLDDSYRNPLVYFAMFKAHSQDSSHASNLQMAEAAYTAFLTAMGIQVKAQKKAAPTTNSPVNPASPAVDKNGA